MQLTFKVYPFLSLESGINMICFCYEHKLGFAKGIPGVPSRYTTSYVTKIVLARVDVDKYQ